MFQNVEMMPAGQTLSCLIYLTHDELLDFADG